MRATHLETYRIKLADAVAAKELMQTAQEEAKTQRLTDEAKHAEAVDVLHKEIQQWKDECETRQGSSTYLALGYNHSIFLKTFCVNSLEILCEVTNMLRKIESCAEGCFSTIPQFELLNWAWPVIPRIGQLTSGATRNSKYALNCALNCACALVKGTQALEKQMEAKKVHVREVCDAHIPKIPQIPHVRGSPRPTMRFSSNTV